jgi:enolase
LSSFNKYCKINIEKENLKIKQKNKNMNMKIEKLEALEILDSRGNPTVEVKITLEGGFSAKAAVPSGASTGSKEALEIRDNDQKRFLGKGVLKVCENIEKKIFPAIKNIPVDHQKEIDQIMIELDGTENKSNLGANAILAVSLAVARVASVKKGIPLWRYLIKAYNLEENVGYDFPVPMMNLVNGGGHADSGLDIQEFMAVPFGFNNFSDRLRAGAEVYHNLKKILAENKLRVSVGDEGGFAPRLKTNEMALELIQEAIKKAGYTKKQVGTGIDAAASEFYDKKTGSYKLILEKTTLASHQIQKMYQNWIKKYNMRVIEDPMSEFDWNGWKEFTKENNFKLPIIGDDLLVTNEQLLEKAINKEACNAILIKVNQIGTLTETINTIKLAKENDFKIAVSHRSGETADDFIADLAVAAEADYVKFGAPARIERVAKYNRILEIEKKEY